MEQGRAHQLDQASSSLKRLEAVVAGSGSRGAAGENILAQALGQLPRDLLDVNVAFGSKIVEYALRLLGGRLLPIDSKWTSATALERLSGTGDPLETRRCLEQVSRDVRARIRDMGKYLDPERTLSIALLAVPDAVYVATPEAQIEGTARAFWSCPIPWRCRTCWRSTG
jgi:DNA recombination protein RmuC